MHEAIKSRVRTKRKVFNAKRWDDSDEETGSAPDTDDLMDSSEAEDESSGGEYDSGKESKKTTKDERFSIWSISIVQHTLSHSRYF